MRIKRGTGKKQKHKKILELTKGYRKSYHKLYRRAQEGALHAGQYSYNDRKKRPGQFKRVWIKRINAALSKFDVRYSEFINKLKVSNILINKKVLAALALDNPNAFEAVVNEVK